MDARRILLDQHALIHSDAVAPAPGKPVSDLLWARVPDSRMRESLPGHCSLAWLLWHMARSEDMGINSVIRATSQVLQRDGWLERLGLSGTEIGTAMSDDEAGAISAVVDLPALMDYRNAVGTETRRWLSAADLDSLDSDTEGPVRIAGAGAFPEGALPIMQRIFADRTGVWVLNRLGIWHNFYHLGEAFHVMQMLGVQTHG